MNNVNSKDMRFVIRNLIDVDVVSSTMAPENLLDDSSYLRQYFPQEEGMMQHNFGRYFPQL